MNRPDLPSPAPGKGQSRGLRKERWRRNGGGGGGGGQSSELFYLNEHDKGPKLETREHPAFASVFLLTKITLC